MTKEKSHSNVALENGKTISLMPDYVKSKICIGENLTYKEICERLCIPYYNSGNQKKAQVKQLKRFIDFEVIKRKWLIKDIYSIPLAEEFRPIPNNSIYIEHIERILLHFLLKQSNQEVFIQKTNLFVKLGLVNDNYFSYRNDYEKLLENTAITVFEINNFFTRSYSYLSKVLDRSINSLLRRNIITCEEVYMITERDLKGSEHIREASKEEINNIERIRTQIMVEYNLEHEGQLLFQYRNKKKSYYSAFNNALYELYGWEKIYKTYHIVYTDTTSIISSSTILSSLSEEQVNSDKKTINEHVIAKIKSQAETTFTETNQEYERNRKRINEEATIFKYPDTYIEAQSLLAELLIKI